MNHVAPDTPSTNPHGLPSVILARMNQNNVDFLRDVPLFRGLPDHQLKFLAEGMQLQSYKKNEVIIEQGAPNNYIYFIKNGVVGVLRFSPEKQLEEVVSYFHANHIFGEFGLFSGEQHIATATVRALSEVTVLRMEHKAFIRSLNDYHPAALEVARILTERLKAPNDKLVPEPKENQIYLILGLNKGAGATTVGGALLHALAQTESTPGRAVYTAYPEAGHLAERFGFAPTDLYEHPAGFYIHVPYGMPRLAPIINLNLILEKLQNRFKTIIFSLPAKLLYEIGDFLEHVTRIILVSSPARWADLDDIRDLLQTSPYLKPDTVIQLVNYCQEQYESMPIPANADFHFPYFDHLEERFQKKEELPEEMMTIAKQITDQLISRNEMRVYLPLNITVAAKRGKKEQVVDTEPALEKIMWVLKQLFGQVGFEVIDDGQCYVIVSHMSVQDINEKWRTALEQVNHVKNSIQQELMAVEINHNLILI